MFSIRELHNIKVSIAEMESFYSLDDDDKSEEVVEAIDGAVDSISQLEKILTEYHSKRQ